ncbi:MAG: YebC/PmpR family DNA-binding transcriptional regulator [Clostridiales bacterium]|nr:YebC/PmpR family DNA-binding transcriptional regulator [Clostridiales bacterium]
MSGHSKWHNIQMKKGKNDAARANVFTKIGREIAVAVKAGGPDPNNNAKLRDVIAKAKAANMPNDNIQRGIKKAAGEGDSVNYTNNIYEGYAPGGIAMIVDTLTDKVNRTVGNVRMYFDKCGGSLGVSGCVSYLFDNLGVIVIEKGDLDEDEVMMQALDAGADDVIPDEDVFEIRTTPGNFTQVRETLEKAGTFKILSAEVTMVPQSTTPLDKDASAKVQRLIDMLEADDDVQNVYHNAELYEEEEED